MKKFLKKKYNYKNKNVLITGATGGIGSALIDVFYSNEYNLFVTGSNKEKLHSIKSKYPKNLEICSCDLSNDKDIALYK